MTEVRIAGLSFDQGLKGPVSVLVEFKVGKTWLKAEKKLKIPQSKGIADALLLLTQNVMRAIEDLDK